MILGQPHIHLLLQDSHQDESQKEESQTESKLAVDGDSEQRTVGIDSSSSYAAAPSPLSPTSLPKPSPPSPGDGLATPEPRPRASNIYSQMYGDDSGPPSGATDDTLPLGSPWATPGIRREPPVIGLWAADLDMRVFQDDSQPDDMPTLSPVNVDLRPEGTECSESSSPDDDPELAPLLNWIGC